MSRDHDQPFHESWKGYLSWADGLCRHGDRANTGEGDQHQHPVGVPCFSGDPPPTVTGTPATARPHHDEGHGGDVLPVFGGYFLTFAATDPPRRLFRFCWCVFPCPVWSLRIVAGSLLQRSVIVALHSRHKL